MRKLSTQQRQVLMKAGNSQKALAKNVHPYTGNALQQAGYGYYHPFPDKVFYLNGAGLQRAYALLGRKDNGCTD